MYGFYLRKMLPVIGRIISGSKIDAYRYLAETITQFLDPEELARIMKKSGFRSAEIHPLTCGIVNVHIGIK